MILFLKNLREPLLEDYFELIIPGLRLWTSLGYGTAEKVHPQPVDITIKISSRQEPLGCFSDQLEDVICYKHLTDLILKAVEGKPFNLIESLARVVFNSIAGESNLAGSRIEIVIQKPNHPVAHVHQPVTFKYARSVPQKSS